MVGRTRKGDPWRHLTVNGHISAPVTSQSELAQQRTRRNRQDHVSSPKKRRRIEVPFTSQSELYQQRTLARRRGRQEDLTFQRPAQALIDAHLRRKAATSRFPPNITA